MENRSKLKTGRQIENIKVIKEKNKHTHKRMDVNQYGNKSGYGSGDDSSGLGEFAVQA